MLQKGHTYLLVIAISISIAFIGNIGTNQQIPTEKSKVIQSAYAESKDPILVQEKVAAAKAEPKEVPIAKTKVVTKTTSTVYTHSSFKSGMDYRCITNTESTQYKIQKTAYTDKNGLRKVDNYYCIAIGQGGGFHIGDKVKVQLENTSFYAIISDLKQNCHTKDGKVGLDGSIVEFLVDSNNLNRDVKIMGSVGVLSEFDGDVVNITAL